MSDNVPFEIQMEIIKWLPVKPLIQFSSVSKQWKSFIESSHFIKGYGARHTQPRSCILRYEEDDYSRVSKYICLIDDDNGTFKVQQKKLAPFVVPPLLKQNFVYEVVGECHGLLCLYGWDSVCKKMILVTWNPSIRKSFGIPADYSGTDYGFGVCPVTKDPTLVKIKRRIGMPWHVEVFTLSSRVWNAIPSSKLPRQSIRLEPISRVVIDRFIYWGASDMTSAHAKYIILSFDLITKEFKVVDLPNSFRNELDVVHVSVAKLRESLVVYGSIYVDRVVSCGVWVMEHDSSFRKLFTIGARVSKILGFSKSGETIFETRNDWTRHATLDVYDPRSQQIKNFGISGLKGSFSMDSYKESLLLLDYSDSDSDLHMHYDDN